MYIFDKRLTQSFMCVNDDSYFWLFVNEFDLEHVITVHFGCINNAAHINNYSTSIQIGFRFSFSKMFTCFIVLLQII